MVLTIDIGNTNINCGIFNNDKLFKKFRLSIGHYCFRDLRQLLRRFTIDSSIICSVVPSVTLRVKNDLEKIFKRPVYVIGEDIEVPIKNWYRKPEQVGHDRLVNAYAGLIYYGAPLIVVDFGTAITFDIISKNKEYLGGMILPGMDISLSVLSERTALLPRIKLIKPYEFIGRDTKSSMISGIIYGYAALTDELTGKIRHKIGKNAGVIGTGGNIRLIMDYCRCFHNINEELTLKGISLLYNKFKR